MKYQYLEWIGGIMPGDMSWMEERYRVINQSLWEPPTLESPNQPRCDMDGKPTIMLSAIIISTSQLTQK